MSTRTVIRHLRRAGTTYQALADAHRREQAARLLATRDLDIAEVGYCLGYQDPASFGRACRRWFGMAPSRYRIRLQDS
jgi:AraC-like DNA-binding protein